MRTKTKTVVQRLKRVGSLSCLVTALVCAGIPVAAQAQDALTQNAFMGSQTDEHVVWDKVPLQLVIPVGGERMISFPARVDLSNNNPDLTTDKVTIYNNAGTLYVDAHKTFAPILLKVKILGSEEVVMVYLSASTTATDTHALDVVVPGLTPVAKVGEAENGEDNPTLAINDVALSRVAMQQFYLQRLATHPDNFARVPMGTHQAVAMYYGGTVNAFPIGSWRAGDLYVTAVVLQNTSSTLVTLDPRNLMGNWQSAAFFRKDEMVSLTNPKFAYNVLFPAGNARDQTMVFVVSDKPFAQALIETNPFVREVSV